jgi:asparagine synthase (glutamine-hydrolysing)
MCGIAGIIRGDGGPVEPEILRRMADVLHHRGPDDAGIFLNRGAGLAHRRLSIIDLVTGKQPLSNEDETLWITFNGEIYNHLELRADLIRQGHRYRTQSDTETIVHAYEEHGADCLALFRGMFAFAIWDTRSATLFLARDRFGIKPLYYTIAGSRFLFASEIKALLTVPGVAKKLNERQVPEFLAQKFIASDETLFAGIRKLMPGHCLTLSAKDLHHGAEELENAIQIRRYWDLRQESRRDWNPAQDLEEELRAQLQTAVRYRLVSDVPVGLFLSGGIDSTIILSVMSGLMKEPVRTFAVGFEEAESSELPYARIAARAFRSVHSERVVTAQDFFRALPRLLWHEDEPIAFPSSIPLYFVSQLAQRSVKVVLSGEGSDELFAGYNRYRVTLWNRRLGRVYNAILPEAAASFIRERMEGRTNGATRFLSRTFLARDLHLDSLYFDNFATFSRAEQAKLLSPYGRELLESYPPYRDEWQFLKGCGEDESLLNQLLYLDLKTYLVELLMKQDQMSMAASVESRVPFLDHIWADFVWHLPVRMKVRGTTTKYLLRSAFQSMIPPQIRKRSKRGFPVPLGKWLRRQMYEPLEQLLLSDAFLSRRYFNAEYVRTLLAQHRDGTRDHTDRLWTLMNFELWCRIFLDGDSELIHDSWHDSLGKTNMSLGKITSYETSLA